MRIDMKGIGKSLPFMRSLQPGRLCVPGIYNTGNICFISALLQAMASCDKLVKYICYPSLDGLFLSDSLSFSSNHFFRFTKKTNHDEVCKMLSLIISKLLVIRSDECPKSLWIRGFYNMIAQLWPLLHFSGEEQQDVDELLYLLMSVTDSHISNMAKQEFCESSLAILFRYSNLDKSHVHPGVGLAWRIDRFFAHKVKVKPINPLQGNVLFFDFCILY